MTPLRINGTRNFVKRFDRYRLRVLKRVKVKVTQEQAMKTQRAVKGIALLFLFSALDEMGAAG